MKYYTERQMLKNTLLKDGDYKTTKEVFERIAKLYPNRNILAELDDKRQIVYHTASDILKDIENLGDGLFALGLEDKHISILAENSYRYIICDVTIAGGVGVVTPIDKDAKEDLLQKLLTDCDADAVICSAGILEKVANVQKICKKVKTIITIDKKVDGYQCFDEIVLLGQKQENAGKYRAKEIDRDKVAEILFTSGTTGANKPVMLTQRNLSANMINCLDIIRATKDESKNTSMSILPMHHATEINTHIMPRIASAHLTYINGSMKDMMLNIKIFKPHIITVVPMIANAFYKNIWLQAKKQGKDKKLKKGIKLCKILSALGIDVTHKLFRDLYVPFGGNLYQIVCGGAPLSPEVVQGLRDLGIFIINGFGITECGPLVSMNTETVKDVKSIGKPCPKLQVKICDKDSDGVGELCVKGDSVSLGYYKDENATRQVYDSDGYFHTGDLAYQNKQGKLFLAGRKKNLIVLSSGKNVYPEELEQAILDNVDYVKDVVVYEADCLVQGKSERLICAGIYIDPTQNITHEQLMQDIRKVNQTLATYKHIAYIDLSSEEYEKNASKKILRKPALKRHKIDGGIKI